MSRGQPLHGAQEAFADFRDQLARHDKPLTFFFGAGASRAVWAPCTRFHANGEILIAKTPKLSQHHAKPPCNTGTTVAAYRSDPR